MFVGSVSIYGSCQEKFGATGDPSILCYNVCYTLLANGYLLRLLQRQDTAVSLSP